VPAVAIIASFEWGWDTFVAVGTLGLAAFTAILARSTRALAAATGEDQRAHWRPVVIVAEDTRVSCVSEGQDGHGHVLLVSVRNVGRGPAFAVQAQLRFGEQPAGASRPSTMKTLVPDQDMFLDLVVSEEARRALDVARRPFPPSVVEIEVSYYDVGERWHRTYLTATRSPQDEDLRVNRVLVNETDRMLLPVHGSHRARAEEARRLARPWRRVARAARSRFRSHRPQ